MSISILSPEESILGGTIPNPTPIKIKYFKVL
jgi:hypothetical protein